jgi:thioredoxin 1
MPRLALIAALFLASAAALGCARAESASPPPPVQVVQAAQASAPPVGGRPRLVFFMNPNGRPCQMQDEILRGMVDLPSRAEVVYYRTTEPSDIARFEQYGVRSIPQLMVTDGSGAVLRRATPGIQSDPQVRQLLAP